MKASNIILKLIGLLSIQAMLSACAVHTVYTTHNFKTGEVTQKRCKNSNCETKKYNYRNGSNNNRRTGRYYRGSSISVDKKIDIINSNLKPKRIDIIIPKQYEEQITFRESSGNSSYKVFGSYHTNDTKKEIEMASQIEKGKIPKQMGIKYNLMNDALVLEIQPTVPKCENTSNTKDCLGPIEIEIPGNTELNISSEQMS